MNKYQFRAIRESFRRDVIYSKWTGYDNNLIDGPIMGKELKDVIILGKPISKHDCNEAYRLTKGGNVYVMYHVDYKHTSSSITIITKNDKIIYWVTSNIGAPYWTAWRHLTSVYHGYGEGKFNSNWQWKSVEDFDCQDVSWSGKEIAKCFTGAPYYFNHTKYQIEMFEKTGGYFIDKIMISQKEINEIAAKEYHWT